MDSEAYQKMLKRIQNTDLNQDPEWRKARQAELDEIGLSTGKKYTLFPNGSIRVEEVKRVVRFRRGVRRSILVATGASHIFARFWVSKLSLVCPL
jgi:hypothetical protein